MLLLLVSFRSVAVAVKAAVMNLLSVAAAYGVVALVLQGGWAGQLVGIDTETPLPAFVPVLMFAVLFGLSMDYEVFLVSRMREAWMRTGDNARADRRGPRRHRPGDHRRGGDHGGGVRGLRPEPRRRPQGHRRRHGRGDPHRRDRRRGCCWCPAVMHLLGRANWWLPAWLDRRLPQLHVEGRPEIYLPAVFRPRPRLRQSRRRRPPTATPAT